ncbi:MAG: ribonuclease III [Acidocella sp. 20-57-95]|nr:MAG: ribonuclease III [Acidocella sp. 20-57-95]OYV57892.1 MAG: ribonuclease III [Acidocella sp. 21-58-7]HQT63320.1 ribonuclease III [Acidocella sp.]HQU03854.1 ribonuclease III [Acidocella sp.]
MRRTPAKSGDDGAEILLGHKFTQPKLLTEALTHRSAAGAKGRGSNERLEFIGDRVLGLLVAEWLIEKFPDEREGALGPRLAALVSRPALTVIAEAHGLANLLAVAPGEAKRGVRERSNVLADALEALIGALYLDGGLGVARDFVRRVMADVVEKQFLPPKDPKTGLQEWALKRALALPAYEVTEQSGPSHAPHFVVKVTVGNASATGAAGSKRAAEQAAATALLGILPT